MNREKNSTSPAILEINPKTKALATLIWLHGLGASNDDFVPVASELQQLTGLALRFVFPQAPVRRVTINNGYPMPAWFDVISFDRGGEIDREGIEVSVQQVKALIEQEKAAGFAANKIFLAGFSQGAVIVLSTMLAYPEALGGVIALSGYLPLTSVATSKQPTPIFLGHGSEDELVPYTLGQTAAEILIKAQYPVTARVYEMPHSVCGEEISDIAEWLKVLAN